MRARPPATPDAALLQAQIDALAHDQHIDRLNLRPLREHITPFDISVAITAARYVLTIEGASYIEIALHDPDWLIEASGVLSLQDDGRLLALDIELDTITYRLVKASREGDGADTLTLTFEDRAVALLRSHKRYRAWSRGKYTRAQALESMIGEVKEIPIPFYAPEKGRRQPVEQPDYPATAPTRGDSGFDTGTKFKIKGVTADAEQMRQVATALGVADQENATPRARMALLVAGIGESGFRAIPNAQGSGYEGVFQASPANIPRTDTEEQARCFLKGGKGFQAGGAIKAARENTGWSAGTIATKVEASGMPGSFYDAHHDEAKHILSLWNGGDQSTSETVTRVKSYHFTRGQPGQPQTSWDAANDWAEKVKWRFFVAGGVASFISDDALLANPASIVLDSPDDDGLLAKPTYDVDEGKVASEVNLRVYANAWGVRPGDVFALLGDKFGPVKGRWLMHTLEGNLLDAFDTQVKLAKPVAPGREPAPDVSTDTKKKSKAGARKAGAKVDSNPLSDSWHLIGKPYEGTHARAFNQAGGSDNWESENAVDLGVSTGTPVLAVDDGTIGQSFGSLGTGGRFAGLRLHLKTSSNEWYYAHLSRFHGGLRPGSEVKAGDTLGYSGEANGVAHLHLACKKDDPVNLLGLKS